MKNRNYSLNDWLHSLKRLWLSLIRSLKALFSMELGGGNKQRSRRSQVNKKTRIQSNPSNEPSLAVPRPKPFLLGLEDIPNLDSLTTKEFISLIEWNAESQEILTAREEDLSLLEDLLVNFPES